MLRAASATKSPKAYSRAIGIRLLTFYIRTMDTTAKRPKLQYPYLVEELTDGWAVLFTETKFPHRVAEFDHRVDAMLRAGVLNESYWSQVAASDLARCLVLATEMPAPPVSSSAFSRLQAALKALLRR